MTFRAQTVANPRGDSFSKQTNKAIEGLGQHPNLGATVTFFIGGAKTTVYLSDAVSNCGISTQRDGKRLTNYGAEDMYAKIAVVFAGTAFSPGSSSRGRSSFALYDVGQTSPQHNIAADDLRARTDQRTICDFPQSAPPRNALTARARF